MFVYVLAFKLTQKNLIQRLLKESLDYLHGINDFGLWYPSCENYALIDFSDVDYADYKVDRKSTSGSC